MAVGYVRTFGDPGKPSRLLDYLSSGAFIEDASDELAAAGLKKIQDGFREERNPYGDRWEGLRYRRGKILQKTGRLYRSATGGRRPGGAVVGLTASYAGYHQDGTLPHARRGRFQPVDRRGRFVSRERAGTYKRSASVRYLRGGQNGGLARREMVPDERGLPGSWGEAFDRSIDLLVARKERGI